MTEPELIVVMGVSGSGKTTVARGIAETMHWLFAEGDDFHPPDNVAKMQRGVPLTDADRRPWLELLGAWLSEQASHGRSAVITCSALRRSYRDVLRQGRPQVRFCHVTAAPELIQDRVEHRAGHYMPPSLLPSQIATLEPLQPDEPGVVVDGGGAVDQVLSAALTALDLTPPA